MEARCAQSICCEETQQGSWYLWLLLLSGSALRCFVFCFRFGVGGISCDDVKKVVCLPASLGGH